MNLMNKETNNNFHGMMAHNTVICTETFNGVVNYVIKVAKVVLRVLIKLRQQGMQSFGRVTPRLISFLPQGMIEAIYLDEGELISAGVDGYIRVSNKIPYYSTEPTFKEEYM